MKEPKCVAGMALGGLACLFILIALATTGWGTAGSISLGLFQVCDGSICASFGEVTGSLAATRAFVVIAFLCSLAAVIDSLIYYVRHVIKDVPNRLLPLISGIVFIIAAVTAIIGAIIFANGIKGGGFSLGYSFGLDIVGGILSGVAGALILVHRQGIGS